MDGDATDPLLLGQRVVAILETGLRTATYKLATMMARVDHRMDNMPERPGEVLPVPIPDLAHRVPEIYWLQVGPFEGHELRQSTQCAVSDFVAGRPTTLSERPATVESSGELPVKTKNPARGNDRQQYQRDEVLGRVFPEITAGVPAHHPDRREQQ